MKNKLTVEVKIPKSSNNKRHQFMADFNLALANSGVRISHGTYLIHIERVSSHAPASVSVLFVEREQIASEFLDLK